VRRAWIAVGAALILIYSLGPIVWIAIASITPERQRDPASVWSSNRAVEYFPARPTLDNYAALFETVPFATYFRNSAIVAGATMVVALVCGSLGAYGFSRFRFRFRGPLLSATLMS